MSELKYSSKESTFRYLALQITLSKFTPEDLITWAVKNVRKYWWSEW